MKRFKYEDDDEFDENLFSDLDELEEGEYEALIEHAEFVDIKNLNLVEFELSQRLLQKAIKLCEKSFFWKFKSVKTKLKLIAEMYGALKVLTKETG